MDSTLIKEFFYDPEKQQLHVTFHSGGQYTYHGVTDTEHEKFQNAPSLGKHFHEFIKSKQNTKK
jgi:hypothetical protein